MSSDSKEPTPSPESPSPAAAEETLSRRQFVIRLTAYGMTAAAVTTGVARVARAQGATGEEDPPLSGTIEASMEIETREGLSSYMLIGDLVYETYENPKLPPGDWGMRILTFNLSGTRVAGPELGEVALRLSGPADGIAAADGTYRVRGPLSYADAVHGELLSETTWSGYIDHETDFLKELRLEGVATDLEGKQMVPVVGVGVRIPIGKYAEY